MQTSPSDVAGEDSGSGAFHPARTTARRGSETHNLELSHSNRGGNTCKAYRPKALHWEDGTGMKTP